MYCFNGTKTNWIHEKVLYNFSNNLTAVVYAFGLFDNEPEEKHWPFFTKEVYYIGMSGGLKESQYVDKKSKKNYRLESYVHKRMKDHKSDKNEGKIIHSWVQEQILNGKQLYISFILPPNHMPKDQVRNWLSAVESEQILTYQLIYGHKPLLNLAENYDREMVDPQSFSQQTIKNIRETSLEKFLINE